MKVINFFWCADYTIDFGRRFKRLARMHVSR